MNSPRPLLSVVVPLFNSAATLPRLLDQLSAIPIEGEVELVLVNDGSRDATEATALRLIETATVPVTFVSLSRNFGEHNAVLAGLRASTGEWVVTMDGAAHEVAIAGEAVTVDGAAVVVDAPYVPGQLQNPPSEVPKLLAVARSEKREVVYSAYDEKKHSWWRNLGSRLTNAFADWSIDKPKGLYLSSFRCLSRFVADEVAKSSNPTPYIDALIFQVTQNVGVVTVRHDPRADGSSGYTLRALLRLWVSMLINASVMPLRVATLLGIAMSLIGFVSFLAVLINHFINREPLGWGSLMAALLLFSGTQLLLLGVVGEYIGRTYLRVSEKPQSVVRLQMTNGREP